VSLPAGGPPLSAAQAVELLLAGGLVAFPTETSWGLGADARSAEALDRLRAFKGRAADKPLSLLVAGRAALGRFCAQLPEAAERLARAFWPGPLTLVLPVAADAPGAALAPGIARDGAVGFRCSPHPVTRALARQAALRGALPITATSLNRSGQPDCRTRAEALRCIAAQGGAVALLAGEDAFGAAPSSVVAVLDAAPRILREGAIPAAQIARALSAPPAPASAPLPAAAAPLSPASPPPPPAKTAQGAAPPETAQGAAGEMRGARL